MRRGPEKRVAAGCWRALCDNGRDVRNRNLKHKGTENSGFRGDFDWAPGASSGLFVSLSGGDRRMAAFGAAVGGGAEVVAAGKAVAQAYAAGSFESPPQDLDNHDGQWDPPDRKHIIPSSGKEATISILKKEEARANAERLIIKVGDRCKRGSGGMKQEQPPTRKHERVFAQSDPKHAPAAQKPRDELDSRQRQHRSPNKVSRFGKHRSHAYCPGRIGSGRQRTAPSVMNIAAPLCKSS